MASKWLSAIPVLASLTFSASLLAQPYAPQQQPAYSSPASGYQQPSYQAPAPSGYAQQQPSYQSPQPSYQQPAPAYQQPSQGYQQQPQSSYQQQPAQGYQQPQHSYQAAPGYQQPPAGSYQAQPSYQQPAQPTTSSYPAQPNYQQPAAASYQAAPSGYTQPSYSQPGYTPQPNYSQQAPALVAPAAAAAAGYAAGSSYQAPAGYTQQPAALSSQPQSAYPAARSYPQSGYPQQGAAGYPAVPTVPATYPPPSSYTQQALYQQLNGGAAPPAGTLAAPAAALAVSAAAAPGVAATSTQHLSSTQLPPDPYHSHRDSKYGHEHVYPDRGTIVQQVPQGSNVVNYAGLAYRFYDAVWYEPRGPAFMVVDPPIGLVVPALPPFATTVSSEGANYVYANDVFYRARPELGGYQVVNDPTVGTPRTAAPELQPSEPPIGSSITVYPRNGQTAQEQSRDHYECYRFAVAQTGYDPMRANSGDAPAKIAQLQSAYDRAQSECFEGRGYAVR